MEQDKEGVTIHCSDGTSYKGDILVGADGAYSGVRQALYKNLEQEGKLPSSDAVELNKGFVCMVGTTKALDPAKYPGVDGKRASCNQIIGKNTGYSVIIHDEFFCCCIGLCSILYSSMLIWQTGVLLALGNF